MGVVEGRVAAGRGQDQAVVMPEKQEAEAHGGTGERDR
jgi:hypothetical protein